MLMNIEHRCHCFLNFDTLVHMSRVRVFRPQRIASTRLQKPLFEIDENSHAQQISPGQDDRSFG